MSTPQFFQTTFEAVQETTSQVKQGKAREIGRSAGGRSLFAITYGEKEPITRTANLSSALAGGKPQAFFGEKPRKRQAFMVTAGVHGAEMEGIAAVLNLLSLMENGKDLGGREWPGILEAAEKLRIVVVPCLNPDGRARIPLDDPTTWTPEEVEKYRHGLDKEGRPIRWPQCKLVHPRDLEEDSFLGGYFNDAGVNPLHGVFLPPDIAPETHAALALALDETPDCVLDLHSCSAPIPFFIVGDVSLPESYCRRQHSLEGFCRRLLSERVGIDYNVAWPGCEGALTLESAYYHICGALPMTFEGIYRPEHGPSWPHERIVDSYLGIFEGLMTAGSKEGFKP